MEENFVKITDTTYKLLDFFPDSDPLKIKAKEKALAILENLTLIFNAKGWASLKKEKAADQTLDDIDVLESYLKLAKYQGWIDNMNFLIITKEYDKIKNQITLPKGVVRQGFELVEKIKDSTPSYDKNGKIDESKPSESYSGAKPPILGKIDALGQNQFSSKTLIRQGRILQILSKKGKAQVSDIIKEIPDITKRTIRRDLDDLLKKGEIIRVGEFNQVFYRKNVRTFAVS